MCVFPETVNITIRRKHDYTQLQNAAEIYVAEYSLNHSPTHNILKTTANAVGWDMGAVFMKPILEHERQVVKLLPIPALIPFHTY